jgi:hypothetical protein
VLSEYERDASLSRRGVALLQGDGLLSKQERDVSLAMSNERLVMGNEEGAGARPLPASHWFMFAL